MYNMHWLIAVWTFLCSQYFICSSYYNLFFGEWMVRGEKPFDSCLLKTLTISRLCKYIRYFQQKGYFTNSMVSKPCLVRTSHFNASSISTQVLIVHSALPIISCPIPASQIYQHVFEPGSLSQIINFKFPTIVFLF